ncbi:MAG: hypothetical protein KDG50_11365 [Chromatiales bacterium]|nr:hypothetical protein [Chromatiales bacterium]
MAVSSMHDLPDLPELPDTEDSEIVAIAGCGGLTQRLTVANAKSASAIQWAGRLPRIPADSGAESDPLEVLARLGLTVFLHNRQSMPGRLRRTTLNSLRLAVQAVRADIASDEAEHDNGANSARYLSLARRAAHELGLGYKALAIEFCAADSEESAAARLESVANAIEQLVQELFLAWEDYSEAPAHVWTEACALYREAERQGFETVPIETGKGANRPRTSVQKRFLTLAMLRLADPYHMPRGELAQVLRYLDRWVEDVILLPTSGLAAAPSRFYVALDRDQPPHPSTEFKLEEPGENWRVIETRGLLDRIAGHIDQLVRDRDISDAWRPDGSRREAVQILRRMLFSWHRTPRARAARAPERAAARVAFGLAAAHARLSRTFAPLRSSAFDVDYPLDDDDALIPMTGDLNLVHVESANANASGITLMVPAEHVEHVSLAVGTIVAVETASVEDHAPVRVGIVRWMNAGERGSVRAGVQYLPRCTRPVVAWSAAASPDRAVTRLGVWCAVAREAGREVRTALVLERGLYDYGSDLIVISTERNAGRVRMDKLIESTPAVERFFCTVLDEGNTDSLDLDSASRSRLLDTLYGTLDPDVDADAESVDKSRSGDKPD